MPVLSNFDKPNEKKIEKLERHKDGQKLYYSARLCKGFSRRESLESMGRSS